MSYYIATVHILFEVNPDAPGAAEDAMSAMLTENLELSGAIKDWGYVGAANNLTPVDIPEDYEEGGLYELIEKNDI